MANRVTINQSAAQLRQKLRRICDQWITEGLPSRQVLERTADELEQWKKRLRIAGIWPLRPLLATATLDDGLGQGLTVIERYAGVVGLEVERIGLLQQPQTIIDTCHRRQPAFLGLTVLQLDSDDALADIGRSLPEHTRLIAGGPVFAFDPEMAVRCNIDFVAADLAHFVAFLLECK
jgi:methylmalonyl-CoA mutase cobalamin-binding subunit